MSKWLCRADAESLVIIDTENVQKSLYDAFYNSCWFQGDIFKVTNDDKLSISEEVDRDGDGCFVLMINGVRRWIFYKEFKLSDDLTFLQE